LVNERMDAAARARVPDAGGGRPAVAVAPLARAWTSEGRNPSSPRSPESPGVGEPRYVGVRELARVLGVSRATIYRAVERGELQAVRVSSVIRILVAWTCT
jgi:excisionase family DNA binding protein